MLANLVIFLCYLSVYVAAISNHLDREDSCLLPPTFTGFNCLPSSPVWTFVPSTGTCYPLPKGTCWTGSTFKSKSECFKRCHIKRELMSRPKRSVSECYLAPITGHCRAYFNRFYYNPAARKCEPFIYTGCGGNGNNFSSFLDCHRTCRSV